MQTKDTPEKPLSIPLVLTFGACLYFTLSFLRTHFGFMVPESNIPYHATEAPLLGLQQGFYYAYVPLQILIGFLLDHYGARRVVLWITLLSAIAATCLAEFASHPQAMRLAEYSIAVSSVLTFVTLLKLVAIHIPQKNFAFSAGFLLLPGACGILIAHFSQLYLAKPYTEIHLYYFSTLILVLLFAFARTRLSKTHHGQALTLNFREQFTTFKGLLKNPSLWILGLIGGLIYLPILILTNRFGLMFLEYADHYSQTSAITTISLLFVGVSIGAPTIGWIADRLNLRQIPISISTTLCFILLSIALYAHHLSIYNMDILFFSLGLFSGSYMICYAMARELAPTVVMGSVFAFISALTLLIGMLFQPILRYLLQLGWRGAMQSNLQHYPSMHYTFALSILPISFILAGILSFILREHMMRLPNEEPIPIES